jgi:hypothetical protein
LNMLIQRNQSQQGNVRRQHRWTNFGQLSGVASDCVTPRWAYYKNREEIWSPAQSTCSRPGRVRQTNLRLQPHSSTDGHQLKGSPQADLVRYFPDSRPHRNEATRPLRAISGRLVFRPINYFLGPRSGDLASVPANASASGGGN